MKNIKLKDYWVSDTSSDKKKNKVYKTQGFSIKFKPDTYYDDTEERILILNQDGVLIPTKKYDADIKAFDNESLAITHQREREKYWLDWYKKQVKEYQNKIGEYE